MSKNKKARKPKRPKGMPVNVYQNKYRNGKKVKKSTQHPKINQQVKENKKEKIKVEEIKKSNDSPLVTNLDNFDDKPIEVIEKVNRSYQGRNEENLSFLYKKAGKVKKTFATLIVILMILAVGATIAVGIIGYNMIKDAPTLELNDFIGEENSIIYDANGDQISELGALLRKNITYDEMPEALVDAFLSIEDSRFFEHPGFDLPRFLSAAIANFTSGGISQGGSTITMQLIKNSYFTTDDITGGTIAAQSYERKAQEIWLALNLETHLSKEEIFALYVNRINFGGNIRGVEKAALYYFGKEAKDLNLTECAYLAGMINSPNAYNAYYHLDAAQERTNATLDLMVYHGYITQEQCDLAKSIKLEDLLVGEDYVKVNQDGKYQSYIDAVIDEAIELTGKDPTIYAMEIYTYMEPQVQDVIEDLQDGTTTINWPDDKFQMAIVSMDNQTGAIVAISGGRFYNNGARLLNRATNQYLNPGSSVKPILSYALAFDQLGWATTHIVTDKPIALDPSNPNSHVFSNFDNTYRGDVTLQQAVAQSLNLPAIATFQDLQEEMGDDAIYEYLVKLGFTHLDRDLFNVQWAIGGYGFTCSVEELAGAHAAMINLGEYNAPHTIEKIVINGETVYGAGESVQVVDAGAAYFVDQLTQYCVEGPYYNYMQILKRDYPVYAKTGTTDWGTPAPSGVPNGAARDKWMVASTNQYTTALWMGYDKASDGYYQNYISQRNLPGNVMKVMLDTLETISDVDKLSEGVEKPEDEIESITYVNGSWPYAYAEDWMGDGMVVTGEILKKFNTQLVSIYDSLSSKNIGTLGSMSGSINADGSITVNWNVSGLCNGGYQDLSYTKGGTTVQASGSCVLDTSSLLGNYTYYGTLYLNDVAIADLSSDYGSTTVWADISSGGTIKACGGFSGDDSYVCSNIATYDPCIGYDENGNQVNWCTGY